MPGGSDTPLGSVPPSDDEPLHDVAGSEDHPGRHQEHAPGRDVGVGYAVYCRDTEGNTFGVYEDDPSAT